MNRRSRYLVWLCAAAGLAFPVEAAGQRFRFSRLGAEDGLSQASVYTIAQDHDGFLWVGTQNGLNRYDGRGFRNDWSLDGEPSPASYAHVRAVHVDREGRLWAGLDDHGLVLFDRRTESFGLVPPEGPAAPALYSGFAEHGDTLFVATDRGLAAVTPSSSGWTLQLREAIDRVDCGADVTAVWADGSVLWHGTAQGCVHRTVGGGEPVTTFVSPGEEIRDLSGGPGRSVWVSTAGSGIRRLGPDGAVLDRVRVSGPANPTDQVAVVRTASGGDTWIGTRGGLGWIPSGTTDTTWISAGSQAEGLLPHASVESVFEDDTGVLWVGTWSGLARLSPYYQGLGFLPRPVGDGGTRTGGIVAMLPDRDGTLLVGTIGGTLARIPTGGAGSGVAVTGAPDFADIFSMARDSDGGLWVATNGRGIHRWDGDLWRSYRAGRSGPGSAPDDRVAAVHVDSFGTVWAGTLFTGLAIYDAKEDRFRAFTAAGPPAEPYVWPIREGSDGGLWFGANGAAGGIHYLDPGRRRLDFFDTSGDDNQRPNAGRILTLALSGDTAVWFGTQGGGLGLLDRRSGDLRFYTTEDGLPHDNVQGVLEDGAGFVWVSTNRGLARFDPGAEAFWSFGEASGVQADRFHANASRRGEDGLLYFGGANGVTVVDPAGMAPRPSPPQVALTGFVVQGRDRQDLNHLVAREGVRLAASENFFSIGFAALDFTEPSLNQFRYRLDDFDPDWVVGEASQPARYTGVPPASYEFVVQARNSEGAWNEAGLVIPIVIEPFFYQTMTFRASVLLLLAGLMGGGYAYRAQQRAHIREMRLQIASDLHDDIGANLNAIALKSDLLRRLGSEAERRERSLSDIQRLANDTMQKVREMIWVVKSEHDSVDGLLTRMEDVATTLLRDMMPFTFTGDADVPQGEIRMEARQSAYAGFKEALQNIIRHSRASEVQIRVSYVRPELLVTISDDGVGFEPATVRRGSGLKLLEERTGMHGARFTIHSRPGEGARVEIRVSVSGA